MFPSSSSFVQLIGTQTTVPATGKGRRSTLGTEQIFRFFSKILVFLTHFTYYFLKKFSLLFLLLGSFCGAE